LGHRAHIGLLARRQTHLYRATGRIRPSCELGVKSALGAAKGLILQASGRVASVLMHLDVAGIQEIQPPGRLASQDLEQLLPQPATTPASPVGGNLTSRTINVWNIASEHPARNTNTVASTMSRCSLGGRTGRFRNVNDIKESDRQVIFLPAPRADPTGANVYEVS